MEGWMIGGTNQFSNNNSRSHLMRPTEYCTIVWHRVDLTWRDIAWHEMTQLAEHRSLKARQRPFHLIFLAWAPSWEPAIRRAIGPGLDFSHLRTIAWRDMAPYGVTWDYGVPYGIMYGVTSCIWRMPKLMIVMSFQFLLSVRSRHNSYKKAIMGLFAL